MLTIYHNPRCSKSRQTLALIEEQNHDVTIVEYLKTPLSVSEIENSSVLVLEPGPPPAIADKLPVPAELL